MKVLLEEAVSEINIKNSRFIAEAFPVKTQAEARDRLHEQKVRYADATHVCHAFIAGLKGETCGMSDDGEPSGTAGRPMLDVLKGSGITNIIITVTRYFGGTLLGTGGLVKAYGDSVKAVLSLCKTEEYVERVRFCFSADYSSYQDIKRILNSYNVSSVQEEFGNEVKCTGLIYASEKDAALLQVKNLTRGKILLQFEEER